MYKTFAAGGMAVLAALAFQPAGASADTTIGIGVGGGWYPPPYEPRYPVYDPDDEDDEEYDYISCSEGRRIVRDFGFYRVVPTRCGGPVYRYEAVKRHRLWSVKVSARSGRVISAHAIGDFY